MKVFVKFVGSVFFVDLRLSQDPHIPTTDAQFSVNHFLKFAVSFFEAANFKIFHPKINSLLQRRMPQAQGINSIFQNNSFIIITAQGNFHHILCENVMISTPERHCFLDWLSPVLKHFRKFSCRKLLFFIDFFNPLAFCFSPLSVRKE